MCTLHHSHLHHLLGQVIAADPQQKFQQSLVEKLWNGVLNVPNLEKIDLSGSTKLIECPNVSGSPNLKYVILDECESMPEVDSSIFHLQKLEVLNVSGCTSLKSISSNTCSPALREFTALNCFNLKELSVPFASLDGLGLSLTAWDGNELPSSLLHAKNLETFIFPISDCLVNLPENFADNICLVKQQNCQQDPFITLDKIFTSPGFRNVKNLIFFDIPMLSEIPDIISLLSSLKTLSLINLAIKSLPETIKYLPQLEFVDIHDCKLLQSIPALSQFIPTLVVRNCESLEEVLSSTHEPYDEPNVCFILLLNCKNMDSHSYQTVLKDAMDGIELLARQNSENKDAFMYYDDDDIFWDFLPSLPGMENWFHYSSTQVSVILELPSNLSGFAYYMVLSQGHMGIGVRVGCECYLDNSLGERICITSFLGSTFSKFLFRYKTSLDMMSDHLLLWFDPQSCKQIMDALEQTKAISTDLNNPKVTFTFFIDETPYDEVGIKECGFRWIYQKETVSSTISKSHDEETAFSLDFQSNDEEETIHPTNFESGDQEETVRPTKKSKQS